MNIFSKDIILSIAIKLDLKDLLNFTQTSKRINSLLCLDTLWLSKIHQNILIIDIDPIMNLYRKNRTWKKYYIKYIYPALKDPPVDVLYLACYLDRVDLAMIAKHRGVDIQIKKNYALRTASREGSYNMVKWLIDNGADVDAKRGEALIHASYYGHYDIVVYLVENGADDYNQALTEACRRGRCKIVMYLLDHFDLRFVDYRLLRYARESGNDDLVKYLIDLKIFKDI